MAKEAFAEGIDSNIMESSNLKRSLFLFISAIVVAAGFLNYFFVPEVQIWINKTFQVLISNDADHIRSWVKTFGWFGPILLILAMIGQMFLMVIPTTVILVVCVLAYGPVWGSVLALFAIYSASSAGYFIGRTFGSITVEKILGSKAKTESINFLKKYGFWAIFITRLNPFLSNDVVSIVGGMARMNYWIFIAASLAGITPLIVCIAVFGESTKGLTVLFVGSGLVLIAFCAYKFFRRVPFPLRFGSQKNTKG